MAVILRTGEQRVAVAGTKAPTPHKFTAISSAILFACLSVGTWLTFLRPNWAVFWHQIDLQVYMWGGVAAALHPTLLYDGRSPMGLPFLYPVFAAWICAELARIPIDYIGTGVVVLTLAALWLSVWSTAVLQHRKRTATTLALTIAVAAAALWLEPVQQTFRFGQLSVILMAMVLIDLALPKGRWYRGILIGIATGIKLTPAVFVVYLLITRQFKAAAVACGAFGATVAIGLWYRPAQAWQFWTTTMSSQNRIGFAFVQNQSINGVFGRLQWSSWDDNTLAFLASGVLAIAGMAAARVAYLRGDQLLGALLAAAVMLLVSPISWTHYWVWVIPAVLWVFQALRERPLGVRIAVPLVIYLFMFAWPMQISATGTWESDLPLIPQGLIWWVPQANYREFAWTPEQFLLGNSYTLAAIGALVAAAVWLLVPRRTATDSTSATALPDAVAAETAGDSLIARDLTPETVTTAAASPDRPEEEPEQLQPQP
ncbi:glycosyltransferase 87 family protein [Nocardia callitridis]|uniref:DUF2029 domain-containing protein n=1 Tax=Nocardia callitridis TaxID=648753 RepID=A0ABP9KJQ7_9NOCA